MSYNQNQPEWALLIKGELNPSFNSYALQLILDRIRNSYTNRTLSLESAIDQLCHECNKNKELFESDLSAIFHYQKDNMKK